MIAQIWLIVVFNFFVNSNFSFYFLFLYNDGDEYIFFGRYTISFTKVIYLNIFFNLIFCILGSFNTKYSINLFRIHLLVSTRISSKRFWTPHKISSFNFIYILFRILFWTELLCSIFCLILNYFLVWFSLIICFHLFLLFFWDKARTIKLVKKKNHWWENANQFYLKFFRLENLQIK